MEKNRKKHVIACDIDGTLMNKNGKLDSDVLDLFKKHDPANTKSILTTGGSYKSALFALQEINKHLVQPIKPYITTSCGSQIYSPEGELIKDYCFKSDDIYNFNQTLKENDKYSMIMYVSDNKYFIQNQDKIFDENKVRGLINALLLYVFKRKEAKKGDASGVNFLSCNDLDTIEKVQNFIKQNGIHAIYVAPTSLSSEQKSALKKGLKSVANKYATYDGMILTIFARSKKDAIKDILEIEKDNPEYVNNLQEVVYLGDGVNDVELLNECNLSVARGEKAKESAKKVAKLSLTNLSEFATKLFKGKYDEQIYGENEAIKRKEDIEMTM